MRIQFIALLGNLIALPFRKKINRGMSMKRIYLILGIIFTIITLIGVGYVLLNHGEVKAGYACVPMVFAIIFIVMYRMKK